MKIRRPVIPITISLAAGIIFVKLIPAAFYFTLILLFSLIITAFHFYSRERKPASVIFLLLAVFAAGGILIGVKEHSLSRKKLDVIKGEVVYFEGKITVPPRQAKDNEILILDLYRLNSDSLYKYRKIKVLAHLNLPCGSRMPDMHWGSLISGTAVALPPDPVSNPAQFDYAEHLKQKEISSIFYVADASRIKIIENDNHTGFFSFIYFLRDGISSCIEKSLPEPLSGLLNGIILSSRRELPRNLEQAFINTGTLHILAASGLNVSIIIGFFLWIFYIFKVKSSLRYLIIFPAIIIYAFIAGASPPIVRASIMGFGFIICMLFQREYNLIDSLFFSALLMLAINPLNLFSASFQLSFTAVLGILLFYGPVRKLFYEKSKINNFISKHFNKKIAHIVAGTYEFFMSVIVLSLVAQIVLLPIIAYYFNKFSLISIIANVIIVPLAGIILPIGLIGGVIGTLWSFGGRMILSCLLYTSPSPRDS